MKLAALGVATAVVGAVVGSPGLAGIGLWWVAMGLVIRHHGRSLQATEAERGEPDLDGGTFAYGTLLWAALGVPSLLVGVLALGIDAGDEGWRWLPAAVGALALGFGVVSALLYLTGSAAVAILERGRVRSTPATIWVRAMEETGAYVNERPRLELHLFVEPDPDSGVASYAVTKKATVPFTAIGSLRVGDGFRAQVAGPAHPTSMDIRWDEPVTRRPASDTASRLDELDRLRREGRVTEEEYRTQRARILESL